MNESTTFHNTSTTGGPNVNVSWHEITVPPEEADDTGRIILGLSLAIFGLVVFVFIVIVILVILCKYGCLKCGRPQKKRTTRKKRPALATLADRSRDSYPSDTLASRNSNISYPNETLNSTGTETLLLPKNHNKRPAPSVPPKPKGTDNANIHIDPNQLPTNVFARDFTIFPIDDSQDSSELFKTGYEIIEEAIGNGEIGIWEKTSHLTETIPCDKTTEGLEELLSKFARENRFSRDQRNDFVSCVVRDKFWDCAVEFRVNRQKSAPFGRYGLVSKRLTKLGVRCTLAFWEVRLMLKEKKEGDSNQSETPIWNKVTENDIISYFRMRALSCLMFDSDEDTESEV